MLNSGSQIPEKPKIDLGKEKFALLGSQIPEKVKNWPEKDSSHFSAPVLVLVLALALALVPVLALVLVLVPVLALVPVLEKI